MLRTCTAAIAWLFFLTVPVSAIAQPGVEKATYTTTVYYVTDQLPIYDENSKALTGFYEQRYTNWMGTCANVAVPWSETCGLQYGFVQWDSSGKPRYSSVSSDQWLELIGRPSHALMFFHGFNEHFGDAIVDGRTFASWLNWKSAKWGDNAVIVYGWPASASAYSRASFFAEYPNDETNNVWTRLHLRAFFRAFRKWTPNTRVTLMGHSMGNQLTLDILLSLREDQLQRLSLLPIG